MTGTKQQSRHPRSQRIAFWVVFVVAWIIALSLSIHRESRSDQQETHEGLEHSGSWRDCDVCVDLERGND